MDEANIAQSRAQAALGFGGAVGTAAENRLWAWALVLLTTMGLLLIRHLLYWPTYHTGVLWFTDDFFYYQVISQNLAAHGLSSFDGQSLTNGYHPLWMALLVVVNKLFGSSLLAVMLLETFIVAAGLLSFLRLFRSSRLTVLALAAFIFFWCVRRSAMQGMETVLLFLLWPLLLHQLMKQSSHAWLIAALCILTIGARLDAIVFVVPTLFFTITGRKLWTVLGSIGFAGGLYLLANQLCFGMPMPVSGSIKSLGGFQFNNLLAKDMIAFHPTSMLRSDQPAMLWIMVAAPFVAWLAPKKSVERRLVLAFVIGSALYLGKLFFFSSWVIWTWYLYPVFFALTAYALAARLHLSRLLEWKWGQPLLAVAATLGLALGAAFTWKDFRPSGALFQLADRNAALAFMPYTSSARVAMGDRAGAFAYFYKGSVTQLEGLVNDKSYFDALKNRTDIKPILCGRGVKYVVDYAEPLVGDTADVETIRPLLASFPAPTLLFHRSDLVATYDASQDGLDTYPDNKVYLWRLNCHPT